MNDARRQSIGHVLSRRQFLALAPIVSSLRPSRLWASRIVRSAAPRIEEFDFASLRGSLVPSSEFYIRDHFDEPKLSTASWKVSIGGQVRSPLSISYPALLCEFSRDMTVTLECAGNPVGGGGLGTAEWTGVPLGQLLRKAGLLPGTVQIRLVGADSGAAGGLERLAFSRSIPVKKALHPDTLLAFHMNGKPLAPEHGFPVRALVPGWYGMDSVKWLGRIEALDHLDTSPSMTRQYMAVRMDAVGTSQIPVTAMRVKSQIAWPQDGTVVPPGKYTIRGAAWAGENTVATVEASTNGGTEWLRASLEGTPAKYAWVLWSCLWDARAPGEYRIMARATDDHGRSQPVARDASRADSYELNWQQTVTCTVRSGSVAG
jgi:DMSO/TMAO reductase YedYZ molybdopterin-dependent catalytic subunit